MDWVTLTLREVESDALPRVCAHCGARAVTHHNVTFAWRPRWVNWVYLAGVLPGMIVASVVSRQMRVSLPVCRSHERRTPGWVVVLGALVFSVLFGVVGALLVLGFAWATEPPVHAAGGAASRLEALVRQAELMTPLVVVSVGGAALGLVFWARAIARHVRGFRRARALEITADRITLVGLADAFVKAVHELRQTEPGG